MTAPPLLLDRDGPVQILTLDDSRSKNALSDAVVDALVDALGVANADETLGCLVLTGAGDCFCSGGNIKDMYERRGMFGGMPAEMATAYRNGIQRIPLAFQALEVPTIAAVNGAAVGAGCDLAAMCDIRLAAPSASFAESFLRVGLLSGDGGAWYLPRVIGEARALEMALTCEKIDAEKALACGLVSRIVPSEELMGEAILLAHHIAGFPRKAARFTKRLFHRSRTMNLEESLDLAASLQAVLQHTEDHREAVAALVEKRKPKPTEI